MNTLRLPAPAKINLSLRVLRKREDGFHDIDTLMARLPGLADEITFDSADSFHFSCSDPTLEADEGNLVVKAVRAFEQASGMECRCRIHLEKRIPHGAGLGGGSSDAATTLIGLNQWHDSPLKPQQLHQQAASIGSDIPFFLHPGAARATGRGEVITAVEPLPELRLLLLKPNFAVATPDAYRRWQHSSDLPDMPQNPSEIDGIPLGNDLERPVFAKHRFLAELKLWLLARREIRAVQLCGSGSTLFAVLDKSADPGALAEAARSELDPSLWHWSGTSGG